MKFTSLFSYYGSKSRIIHKYPRPRHNLIIEPFAGSAVYSIHHARPDRHVILNELHHDTYELWEWLTNTPTSEIIAQIPDAHRSDKLTDIVEDPDSPLMYFLQAWANGGTAGRSNPDCIGVRTVTPWGATGWGRIKPALRQLHPRVIGWQVLNGSYEDIPNLEATWYVDPPYNNHAGAQYHHGANDIDYAHLAKWCRSRKGFVIVCENEGADWLPFKPLVDGRGQKSTAGQEVIWTNERIGLMW